METEIAIANVYDLVEVQESDFSKVVSCPEISWDRECGFAKQALQNNDFLNKTAWNNQQSLANAIVNVASIGISLNPAAKHAYLVPRDSRVCLDVSYMGLLHLAVSAGSINWGQAKIVYSNDHYLNNGIDKAPTHQQKTFGEKGDIVGVYCTVKLPSGDYLTEEMDIAALNKVKSTSKAAKGPWKTWPDEMMRKTVVKRASKYWPQNGNRLQEAITVINDHEGLQDADPELLEEGLKSKFMELMNDENAFGIAAFMACQDENTQMLLCKVFDPGKISAGKAKLRELQASGFNKWTTFAGDVKTAIDNEDKDLLEHELLVDFEKHEKVMLCRMIGDDYKKRLGELIGGDS